MAILADITSEFISEVPECGSASKCYCITCTRKRAYTWRLFAAWRQVARDTNNDPAPIKLHTFCTKYATSVLQYNQVVVVVQDIGNCNGEYAAGITAQIMAYCNAPTAQTVSIEYMSCAIYKPQWTGEPQILTLWYDALLTGLNRYRWVYIRRKTLFRYFHQSYEQAILGDMKNKFKKLRNSVPVRLEDGTFKNKIYMLSNSGVEVPDSSASIDLSVVDVFDPNDARVGVWDLYWGFYEQAFGL